MKTESYTLDKFDWNLTLNRVSRGIYTIGGIVDIKQSVTDDTVGGLTTYYSISGQNYAKAPFFVQNCSLSCGVNEYYRNILMEDLMECADNVLILNDSETFEPPLTPRLVTLRNCSIRTDNLPSVIRAGFYKIVIEFKNELVGILESVIQVQSKY